MRSRLQHGDTKHHTAYLQCVRQCGLSFQVLLRRNADGTPSSTYEWTAVSGSEKKLVLPDKLECILPDNICNTVVKLWTVC